jgi:AcrR family transcriptional regulator
VREAFVDATRRLLEQRRLEDLTVVDLIEAAGFSRPTFYEYFGSKHSVVAALAGEVLSEIYERLWRPVFDAAGPMTRELWISHYLQTLATWRRHQAVLVAAAEGWRTDPAAYDAWGASWQSYVADVAKYIERARAAGAAPPRPDAEMLAETLVWLSETVLYLAHSDTSFEIAADEDLAATMSAVWLRSIHETAEPLST